MSATQAMSSARRRRGAPPQQKKTPSAIQPTNQVISNQTPQQSAGTLSDERQHLEVPSFHPVDLGQSPNNPTELLLQHDRRLYNLENGVAEALGILNGNVAVLTEGYQSLSSSKEGSQAIFEIQNQLKELLDRVKSLEDSKSYSVESEDNEDGSDEVSISFSGE